MSGAVNDLDSDIDYEDTCESLSDIGDLGGPTANMIPVLPEDEYASPISQFGEVDYVVPMILPTGFHCRRRLWHIIGYSRDQMIARMNIMQMNNRISVRHYGPTSCAPKGHKRSVNSRLFYTTSRNGESQNRQWLLYSPLRGSVHCFYWVMMRSNKDKFCTAEGFSSWFLVNWYNRVT